MLVLSRKAGQRINIGDDIVIEIRRVAGNRVTVALDAPRDVRILRGELQQAATEFELDMNETEVEDRKARVGVPHAQFAHLTSQLAASEMVG